MKIGRTYCFEAAHHLPSVPAYHKCSRLHGHNYRVEVQCDGTLDKRGMVADFFELDEVVVPLVSEVDHQTLNDIDGLDNPTAENIALWFFERIQQYLFAVCIVRVWENDDCWAECGDNWGSDR